MRLCRTELNAFEASAEISPPFSVMRSCTVSP
uniref:Uncharacterized protein n=1 Tax=Anguilla anguilla TaxID=7936 RepID=A0A0E9UZ92_ANGAN